MVLQQISYYSSNVLRPKMPPKFSLFYNLLMHVGPIDKNFNIANGDVDFL